MVNKLFSLFFANVSSIFKSLNKSALNSLIKTSKRLALRAESRHDWLLGANSPYRLHTKLTELKMD